jgi:hypothetical protein
MTQCTGKNVEETCKAAANGRGERDRPTNQIWLRLNGVRPHLSRTRLTALVSTHGSRILRHQSYPNASRSFLFFLLCHKWIWPKIGNDEQKLDQLGRQHSADQDKPDDAKSSGPKPKRGTAAAQLIQIPKMSAHP